MPPLPLNISQPISKPHAVVLPWPGQGHINPMMHLSRKLASKGISVTFVNTEHNHLRLVNNLAESNLPTLQDQGLDIRLVGIPDGLPPDHPRIRGGDIVELCQAIVKMATVFEELIERLMHQEPPITFIVSDIFMFFTQDVANKFGIPLVAFWTQSATSYLAHLLTDKAIRSPQAGSKNTLASAAILSEISNLVPRNSSSPPLRLSDMPSFLQPLDLSDFLFDFATLAFPRIHESAWILLNDIDELEANVLKSLRKNQKNALYTVGPVLPTDFIIGESFDTKSEIGLWREEYSCLDWLDKQSPCSVLYIAFGSVAVLHRQQVEEIALGLEACQQRLLWVLRPDLMHGESAILPEGFVERIRSRALFISWAPQLQVLSHPSVGGFLTHCGWNSTLESISRGVPMLCWPYFADQMLNCRWIVDYWRIGLSLKGDGEEVVWRGEVEKKVRGVMEDKEEGREMRGRACELKEAIRRANGEGGSTLDNFDLFIHQLMRHHIKKSDGV